MEGGLALSLSGVDAIDYMYNHRLSAKQAGRLTDEQRIILAGAILSARLRHVGRSSQADEKVVSMLVDVMALAPILSEGLDSEGLDALRKALAGDSDMDEEGFILGVDGKAN